MVCMPFGQVANFKTNSNIPIEKFAIAINSNLKKSIIIQSAEEVEETFHSRLSCKRKTYRYIINNSKLGTAIYRNLETHIPMKLDLDKMKQAIQYFIGEHDFAAFCSAGAQVKTTVRNIYAMEIEEEQAEGRIRIRVTGNGFLYNMVRIITGTLLEVGKGTLEPESVPQIIASCNRGEAGPTAPAKGLKLLSINFDTD